MPKVDPKKTAPIVLERLRERLPHATTALHHRNAFELLAATILSAQCTDERVNQVTPELFARYPTPVEMADADPTDVEMLIRSTGFFRNKARALIGMARGLLDHHGGQVPASMEALVQLPGVARKTANVVLGTSFNIASGVVVDTHVKRVSQRLGLTKRHEPEKIERDLMELIPQKEWIDFGHLLIWHGRLTCKARKPDCEACVVNDVCPSAFKAGQSKGRSKR